MTPRQKFSVGTLPDNLRSDIDTSHYGLIRQLNEYAETEGHNQVKLQDRLCSLLEKVNPAALEAIRNAVRAERKVADGPDGVQVPQAPNLTTCVNMLPRPNSRVYEVLEALENAIQ